MLDKNMVSKEIEYLSGLITKLEMAMIVEDDEKTKGSLRSAVGQLKAGRTWLIKIVTGKMVRV